MTTALLLNLVLNLSNFDSGLNMTPIHSLASSEAERVSTQPKRYWYSTRLETVRTWATALPYRVSIRTPSEELLTRT